MMNEAEAMAELANDPIFKEASGYCNLINNCTRRKAKAFLKKQRRLGNERKDGKRSGKDHKN